MTTRRPDDPGQRDRDPAAPSGAAGRGTAERGSLAAGHPVDEFVPGLAEGETVLALAPLDGGESSGVALGTASGVVKRVQPDYPANRDEFELITLKDDDRVVGAAYLTGDEAELVFITSDAQLLRFPASAVRPQGRPAGGMAGIRLSDGASVDLVRRRRPGRPGARAGDPAADPAAEAVVVTVAGRSGALPGTGGASVKVTPFAEYPAKGRATGGVRCQRFLKGEDGLIQAWIGPPPVSGATESGVMVDLSGMTGRRDGSGNATRLTRHPSPTPCSPAHSTGQPVARPASLRRSRLLAGPVHLPHPAPTSRTVPPLPNRASQRSQRQP